MADPRLVQLVDQEAQRNGVPIPLARALVNQESGFNPHAVSPAGAKGMMQLMPGTAHGFGVTDPMDPVQNVQAGMKYLGHLLQQFKDPRLALAAYNAGPAAVTKYGGVPPYAETQHYVTSILAAAGHPGAAWGGGAGDQGRPLPPGSPAPDGLAGMTQAPGGGLAELLQAAAPSETTVSALQRLGGTAASVARRAQEPIPLPQVAGGGKTSSGGSPAQQDPYDPGPQIQIHGLAGNIPMTLGGKNPYTGLHFANHVDFQHVNPRLLQALDKEAQKLGKVITVISGYRDNHYSTKNGGFAGDPHTKGLAVDAYVNGHPIGDVVPPETWAKYGIRSGNTPGFYKGKPDPEHLDLIGVPVKGGKPQA